MLLMLFIYSFPYGANASIVVQMMFFNIKNFENQLGVSDITFTIIILAWLTGNLILLRINADNIKTTELYW